MQLQEFDLTIEHIKGINNHFADILSRNPVGISNGIKNQARGQHEFVVAKINLDVDKLLVKELRNIAFHQNSNPDLMKIRQHLEKDPMKYSEIYCVNNDILSCKDVKNHPYWRVMIPKSLEYSLIKYVHTSMGHSGTDKLCTKFQDHFM
jgi:hypothetical protein